MSKVATPGERLFSLDTHLSGPGTYTEGSSIISLIAGSISLSTNPDNEKKPTVSVVRKGSQPVFPKPGSIVTVKVTRVSPRLANTDILCIGTKPVDGFSGVIRSVDVRATEIDKVELLSCYRPGDVVRAEVLSVGDVRSFFLTTAKNELGVIFAKSLAALVTMSARIVFVTVGTTKFDALIKAVDDPAFADELAAQKFTTLVVQRGDGAYTPHKLVAEGQLDRVLPNGLRVEFFKYAPNLEAYMGEADLIISHAGAGSLFEALRKEKSLIAVPNSILMHNHQAELAEHLEKLGHCFTALPDTLLEVMQQYDPAKLVPYTIGDAAGIVEAIEDHMKAIL